MNPKKRRTPCLACGKEPKRPMYKYCSNKCQGEYQYVVFIQKWKEGKEVGLSTMGVVKDPIKSYLRQKFSNKCCLCEWSEVNPQTGIVPLIADHIDGRWQNNQEDNLRLLCPNCDALTPTFGNLNRGKGRANRPKSKRAADARAIVFNYQKT